METDVKYKFNDKAKCPYCDYDNEVEAEDYTDQDQDDEMECGSCQEVFCYTSDHEITHSTRKWNDSDK